MQSVDAVLRQAAEDLDALGARWAVIGGFGSRLHAGLLERGTRWRELLLMLRPMISSGGMSLG